MDTKFQWHIEEEIAKQVKCKWKVAKNVVDLLEKGNTVPFISRYRRDQTECMEPEQIREIKDKVDELKEVQCLAVKAVNYLEKIGQKNSELEKAILEITDLSLLKDLTCSLKPEGRTNKTISAYKLEGIEDVAKQVLSCQPINISALIKRNVDGLSTYEKVSENLSYVIRDILSKEKDSLDFVMQKCKKTQNAFVISKKINSKKVDNKTDVDKFKDYFDLKISMATIKPYKYLAMKRGEALNVLKTSLELDISVEKEFVKMLETKFKDSVKYSDQYKLLMRSIKLAYDKIVMPRIVTKLRNNLKKIAEESSIKNFCSNLKQLLMMIPVRNQHILGVDPGYKHGCKFALIGPMGEVLETGVFYLCSEVVKTSLIEVEKVKQALFKHRCEIVAIGNGVGCRSAEEFFSHHNKIGTFTPLKVSYSIVLENGASVYSASDLAIKEFPNLEITLRGAVSIARRLQDPLTELIKIDPKNLGIGMYQHDISDKKLKTSLDGVVEDCISLVGVDLNVCNELILQHIGGLGPVLAKNIITKRSELGHFKNRHQLLQVRGLGYNKFQQCAGFLKINLPDEEDDDFNPKHQNGKRKLLPDRNLTVKRKKTNKNGSDDNGEINHFDKTTVHPESYELASKFLKVVGLNSKDIGKAEFCRMLTEFVTKTDIEVLSQGWGVCFRTINQIIESLMETQDHDIRDNYSHPIFRSCVMEMKDIRVGQILTGRITNVTDFGAFVDIGVETSGLIHSSDFPICGPTPALGMIVSVSVWNVDRERNRIGLRYKGET